MLNRSCGSSLSHLKLFRAMQVCELLSLTLHIVAVSICMKLFHSLRGQRDQAATGSSFAERFAMDPGNWGSMTIEGAVSKAKELPGISGNGGTPKSSIEKWDVPLKITQLLGYPHDYGKPP